MLTLYARKEPPESPFINLGGDLQHVARPKEMDIVIYRDAGAQLPFIRFQWCRAGKPDRRRRYINLNCYRWRLQWLPAVGEA